MQELLTNDDSLRFLEEPDSVIDVSVNVQTQRAAGKQIALGSEVDIIHYGGVGITDVAALLTFLVNRNNTDSSFIYLDHIIKTEGSIELIAFDYVSESVSVVDKLTTVSALKEVNKSKKTLLFVTTLLSITLFGMSAILVWIGGGWVVLRKKVEDLLRREEELTRVTMKIESKPTADTQDADEEDPDRRSPREGETQFTNPSGILGANHTYGRRIYSQGHHSNVYGLGVKTPGKMPGDSSVDDLATPMSVMSDYSDTNRAPIGIMSMRKLVPSPLQRDDDDNKENDSTEGDSDGMKKLKF